MRTCVTKILVVVSAVGLVAAGGTPAGAQTGSASPVNLDAVLTTLAEVTSTSLADPDDVAPGAGFEFALDDPDWSIQPTERSAAITNGQAETRLAGTAVGPDGEVVEFSAVLSMPECPDARRRTPVEITVDITETLADGTTTSTRHTITATGRANARGRLSGINTEVATTVDADDPTASVDWTARGTATRRGTRLRVAAPRIDVEQAEVEADAEDEARDAYERAVDLAGSLLEQAQARWSTNRCRIVSTGGTRGGTTSGNDLKVSGTAYDGTYSGVKCGGPAGVWKIEGTAPGNPKRVSKITLTLDASGRGSYEVNDAYYTSGNPQPTESSEEGPGAVYDASAKTLTFGYQSGYRLNVEVGSFC
jgi:hypothetical protein